MGNESRLNRLTELLKERNGFILIEEAVDILGAREYTRCLEELYEKGEDDPEHISTFFQNGDAGTSTGEPTHICFSDAFMGRIMDILDDAIESAGHISPRTKGLRVN